MPVMPSGARCASRRRTHLEGDPRSRLGSLEREHAQPVLEARLLGGQADPRVRPTPGRAAASARSATSAAPPVRPRRWFHLIPPVPMCDVLREHDTPAPHPAIPAPTADVQVHSRRHPPARLVAPVPRYRARGARRQLFVEQRADPAAARVIHRHARPPAFGAHGAAATTRRRAAKGSPPKATSVAPPAHRLRVDGARHPVHRQRAAGQAVSVMDVRGCRSASPWSAAPRAPRTGPRSDALRAAAPPDRRPAAWRPRYPPMRPKGGGRARRPRRHTHRAHVRLDPVRRRSEPKLEKPAIVPQGIHRAHGQHAVRRRRARSPPAPRAVAFVAHGGHDGDAARPRGFVGGARDDGVVAVEVLVRVVARCRRRRMK